MHAYDFVATNSVDRALKLANPDSAFLAGGTTLVDLMKLDVMTPRHVIDINGLDLCGITANHNGLRIGAMARMSDVANHSEVANRYPMLTQALLLSASGQIRNMASVGGNLLQRTRCDYFRDVRTPCNKREPGSGCPAQTGENRNHAILGTSTACVATHPSDLAVALVALGASVRLRGREGVRQVPLDQFYRLPGDTPHLENQLRPGELITEVLVPALSWARRSTYLKIRDRSSYEFALTSVAVALDLRDGTVHNARIAVGGVGARPWRLPAVEDALRQHRPTADHVQAAAARAAEGARPLAHNGFKVTLMQRTITRAVLNLAGRR
ncbi:xanthine dehydrogenase family protein subunit M [Actinophytocola sp.]|uniref:FAD binding domain-containing protein n=1 Tax=Actinophytocola sp. TaxID=1872138 RepID=UPI002ED2084D